MPRGKIVLLMVAAVLVMGAGSEGCETTESGGGSDKQVMGKVNEAVENAGTTYKVTKVVTKKNIGGKDFGDTAAGDGIYVVVTMELTNNKDETKTFDESGSKLVTTDDKKYESATILSFGDESLLFKEIQPDLTTTGKIAFEVPKSKVAGSKLVIEDFWGNGEIVIDLGLK